MRLINSQFQPTFREELRYRFPTIGAQKTSDVGVSEWALFYLSYLIPNRPVNFTSEHLLLLVQNENFVIVKKVLTGGASVALIYNVSNMVTNLTIQELNEYFFLYKLFILMKKKRKYKCQGKRQSFCKIMIIFSVTLFKK